MFLPTLTSAGYLWPCDQTVSGFPNTPCTGLGTRLNDNVGRIPATCWDNSSTYEGLQAGPSKRMSHRFHVRGRYTGSKLLGMGSGVVLRHPDPARLSCP